jgi:hypothetical protein
MKENTSGHRGLTITVTREGKKSQLPMLECTKGEITDYFTALSHEDLLAWTFLLAGYACGSDAEIERLNKREVDFTRGG